MWNRTISRHVVRATLVMSLFVLGAIGVAGCSPQDEGDRCTEGSGTKECASGLTCTVPQNCIVSFCCPASEKNATGICGGCPSDAATVDAGDEGASDAASETASDTLSTDSGIAIDSGAGDATDASADVTDASDGAASDAD